MVQTHLLSLPDIVLLDIFSYLSCEDVLCAFGSFQDVHLLDLLTEYGAFRRICLSSQLPRHQYEVLSSGIWRYGLVRSFVCKEMFSDFIPYLTPSQIFPSLTELRICSFRCFTDELSEFVIAHSSTLTHLSVKRDEQSFFPEGYRKLLNTVLPHLNRLSFLDTDWRSYISIQWSRLGNCLQSLKFLLTYVETMSEVYQLAEDGFLPHLKSLRIFVQRSVITTTSSALLATTSLRLPNLETFDLHVQHQRRQNEDEEEITWTIVEKLISRSVMPRLRRCSLVYALSTNAEIADVSQFLSEIDKRQIRLQYVFYIFIGTSTDSSNMDYIRHICHTHPKNILVQYYHNDKSVLYYSWFSSSWPSWTIFWMNSRNAAPRTGIRRLGIKDPNISLNSLGELMFSGADELTVRNPGSLSIDNSALKHPTPLINLRRLIIYSVVPGLELLLDGMMLPRLQSIRGLIVPLFIAFACRTNQMKTLDTVDHLTITDLVSNDERCFSFKQWHIVLDVLPRLRTLLVQLFNSKCPPMAMADLFVEYMRGIARSPLTLFSCCIEDSSDAENKEHFITYLQEGIRMGCSSVQITSISPTRLDAWM